MDHHFRSEFPPSMFGKGQRTASDVDQAAYFMALPTQHLPHDSQGLVDQTNPEYPLHFSGHWQRMNTQYEGHTSHQSHQAASLRSSRSSNVLSSNDSIFSQWHPRDSIASTNTTWSHYSDSSREHYISQAERSLSAHPSVEYPRSFGSPEEPARELQQNDVSQRQTNQEKEPFSTCVSRAKRSRRSTKEPRYWCTSCKEGFGEKYDWKRHEETYQERFEMYECDLCKKTYFLDKDFIHHHQKGHRCRTCSDNQHVEIARRARRTRTGWGCGFCLHFDTDWIERCKHIAWHFEKRGDTMANWKHTSVILSLLQQTYIHDEWIQLLEDKKELNPRFRFNQTETGRVEGFPDSHRSPQLQDLLEFFTHDQSASDLVRLAYEQGHLRQHRTPHSLQRTNWIPDTLSQGLSANHTHQPAASSMHEANMAGVSATQSSHSSTLEKELPLVPPSPPVPPKDHHYAHSSSTLQNHMDDFESWSRLISTIPEDDILPDAVPMEVGELNFDTLDGGFNSNYNYC